MDSESSVQKNGEVSNSITIEHFIIAFTTTGYMDIKEHHFSSLRRTKMLSLKDPLRIH